jgi:hypothetical protein
MSHHLRSSSFSSSSSALSVSFDTPALNPQPNSINPEMAIEWPLSCKAHRVAFRINTTHMHVRSPYPGRCSTVLHSGTGQGL